MRISWHPDDKKAGRTMGAISVKALVVGNIVNVVALIAMMFAVLVTWLVLAAALAPGAPDIDQIAKEIKHSQALVGAFVAITVSANVLAGYVAGTLANRAWFLNGAFAGSIWVVLSLYELLVGPLFGDRDTELVIPPVVDYIVSYGCPLFAMSGGYLAMARARPVAA
jgi:uncharacterized membrane protein (DUF441 family)